MYDVKLYEDAHGYCHFAEFIADLDDRAMNDKRARSLLKKVMRQIAYLKEGGTWIGEPFVKHIEGDLWELRPGSHRVLFFAWHKSTFVLLHTFVKKTEKTPLNQIEQAKREMQDRIGRHGN
jgi:phage-related protein